MGEHQFASNRQPETGSAGARRAAKRGKKVLSGLWRHARAGIVDGNGDDAAHTHRRNTDSPRPAILRLVIRQGLDGIATDIVHDTEQLLAVGIDLEVVLHLNLEFDA